MTGEWVRQRVQDNNNLGSRFDLLGNVQPEDSVSGRLSSHLFPPPTCTSPIGLRGSATSRDPGRFLKPKGRLTLCSGTPTTCLTVLDCSIYSWSTVSNHWSSTSSLHPPLPPRPLVSPTKRVRSTPPSPRVTGRGGRASSNLDGPDKRRRGDSPHET